MPIEIETECTMCAKVLMINPATIVFLGDGTKNLSERKEHKR